MDTGAPLLFDAVPVPTPPGGPLVAELVPAPDPWAVARKLAHLPHLLFLDSAERHGERGRYSYVAATGEISGDRFGPEQPGSRRDGPFAVDQGKLASFRSTSVPGLPPFQGGIAGLLSYGLSRTFERIPEPRRDEFHVPDSATGTYDWVISFDHSESRAWLVSTGYPFTEHPRQNDHAVERLRAVLSLLRAPRGAHAPRSPGAAEVPRASLCPQYPLPGFPGVTSNFSREGYEAAVRRAVEYVHAGDCFQVNLSQRLLSPLREHPLELYGRLRERNPAPFAAYFDLGDFQVLSASPERFLRAFPDGEVETRPIKGTRPRGRTPEEDAALVRDLASSPKDRAENVMIVDLLRNDIGKVCEFGSVRVPRVCEVETFRFVHHLVSEVRGTLRPGLGALDLLAAAFPGGSVTGAPKVRAMEIIAELEPTARGPYCGCLGWVGFDGAMDTNILIRTFTAGRGWVQFPVGGGVVADSDPAREYEETLHKAAGLLRALK
ncbi:aminodeoxychorismate synthase component I [Frigoriglobus tundricola]|uniref:aminodeoxychorismate synthase n=1 Tax=Frigoriglobus tundricola TaxID=2774151 RepID=A0A6M5YMI9_9BACT|nr:aminodeoxychorismate synthase component I [Frigoriglobus tundricola]QJW95339.1 Para-aminobenzoate synthase, aminase component [Frigoriglobus tundricola]